MQLAQNYTDVLVQKQLSLTKAHYLRNWKVCLILSIRLYFGILRWYRGFVIIT